MIRAKTTTIYVYSQEVRIYSDPNGMAYSECIKPRWDSVVPYENAAHGLKPTRKKILSDIKFLIESTLYLDKIVEENDKIAYLKRKQRKADKTIKRLNQAIRDRAEVREHSILGKKKLLSSLSPMFPNKQKKKNWKRLE